MKTLIFCFDGTSNDPEDVGNYVEDRSITNIQKLHVLFGGSLSSKSKNQTYNGTITNDNGLQQRSFYYRGVGTYGGLLRRTINKIHAPERFFSDAKSILNDAINDLEKHHMKGSHVLVFGFSRGATLARRFATVAKNRSGIEGLKIDFLGVFDSVTAFSLLFRGIIGTDFGIKKKPVSDGVLENGTMSQDVRKTVHLVALDENRAALQPALFNYAPDRITEIWFPGTHSDVGGGCWKDGLSDLALEYMIKKLKQECVGYIRILNPGEVEYGQLNNKDDKLITEDDISRKALVNGVLHENKREATSVLARLATGTTSITIVSAAAGIVAGYMFGVTAVAIYVVKKMPNITQSDFFAAGEIFSMSVLISGIISGIISYIVVSKMIRKRIRKALCPRHVRVEGERPECVYPMVHESVQFRYKKVRGYRPHALRNVKYVVTGKLEQPGEAELKDPSFKYVVTADDEQVGDPRQGVSELGGE